MKKFLLSLAVAIALLSSANTANAAFKVRAFSTNDAVGFTVTDDGAGDSDATDGRIIASGTVGSFDLVVTLSRSKPLVGSASSPVFRYTWSWDKIAGSAADTLTIEMTDTDFGPLPAPALSNQVGGSFDGSTTSVTQTAGFDNENDEFSTEDGSVSQTFLSSPYSGANSFGPAGASPYSLTSRVVVVAGAGAGGGSADGNISAVPAPAGVLLLLAGAPCMAIGYLRRRKVAQA